MLLQLAYFHVPRFISLENTTVLSSFTEFWGEKHQKGLLQVTWNIESVLTYL